MAVTVSTALSVGLQAHRSGQLDKAIAVYGAVLDLAPDHPTARHLRGFALLQADRGKEALADLQAAVRSAPTNADAWSHLAICLDRLHMPATRAARLACLLRPADPEAVDIVLRGEDESQPGVPPSVRRLVVLAPGEPKVWARVGHVCAQAAPTKALRALRRARCLAPADPSIGLDQADLERRANRPEVALALANRMLVLHPNDPRALAERAAALADLDAVADALADTRRAILQAPAHAIAWGNRAEILYRMAGYGAALQAGERARLTVPDDPKLLTNLAAYRLAIGDLARGWPLLRYRSARRLAEGPDLPRWTGQPGASLLVLAEQGLGDELLFSTLWGDLDRLVAEGRLALATVETDARLIPLGARAQNHLSWRRRSPPDRSGGPFTHWCLAGDLMELLRPTIESFGAAQPGVRPDPDRVGAWKGWLQQAAGGRPSIGLCWRSGSRAGHRRRHYPTIEECAPLLALENKFFVILQYDDCSAEIDGLTVGAGSEIALPPELDRRNDQDGVAALMAALDLVISADTAVLALAGALRVPTIGWSLQSGWVGLGQPRHPWFPTVERAYRPPEASWRDAIRTVARMAERKTAKRT